jgi:adenine deaminase
VRAEEVEQLLEAGKLCKIAVIERHGARGFVGVGLLSGYGLKGAAVASTVGHDSHNLIVAGTHDADMLAAAERVREIKGGYTLVHGGKAVGDVRLPVYGLMSGEEPEELISALDSLTAKTRMFGVPAHIEPFITLSFMALPVIPEIRITDMGMFDVTSFSFI